MFQFDIYLTKIIKTVIYVDKLFKATVIYPSHGLKNDLIFFSVFVNFFNTALLLLLTQCDIKQPKAILDDCFVKLKKKI